MSSTVEKYKFPVGSRENPAMTCKELVDIDNIRDGEDDYVPLLLFILKYSYSKIYVLQHLKTILFFMLLVPLSKDHTYLIKSMYFSI